MKNKILILFIFITINLIGQQEQKGLLWKISGNGLEKPSFVYGNMHVSGKIAFHLGEEFFESINSVDKIALESNPIVWLDEIFESEDAADYIGRDALRYRTMKGFYKNSFESKEVDNDDLARVLSVDHYFMDWMLYRSGGGSGDFEEETFLDMFIYQSGAKNNKEVISLENFIESSKYSKLASIPDIEDKERSKWIKDLMQEKRYIDLVEEAYRSQNLTMIDSLQKEMSSNNNLYWMLQKRNENMVSKMDSILQSGTSLFSGVGAAHLPGKNGMLKMLEAKGYTVESMTVTFSDKAKKTKEEYSKKKLAPKKYYTYNSDLFSMEAAAKVYETPYSYRQRFFFGPELTNGSSYTVKQISTFAPLYGKSIDDYLVKIDSLLFENIPGKIQRKTFFEGDFYKGIDVLNKTKTGDYQRYRIYITDMNIIMFKFGGKDDYVLNNGDRFFNSIKLKKPSGTWIKTRNMNGDISVDLPDNTSLIYNKKVVALYGQPVIESYDITDSSYYLLKRKSIYDWQFIEQDTFELKRIAQQFFIKMDLDTVDVELIEGAKYPSAIAYCRSNDSSYLAVKAILNGPFYYVLLAKTNTFQKSNKFFDSFMIDDFVYTFDMHNKIDSNMLFSVKSNYIYPKHIDYLRKKARLEKKNKNNTKDVEYKQEINNEIYYSETFEKVHVKIKKYRYYQSYPNLDSLWSYETDLVANDEDENNFLIIKDTIKTIENGLNVYYLNLTDTSSSRVLSVKFILKHGMLYRIKTISDSIGKQSVFVKSFLNTFTPFDTIIGYSPLSDKASMFMKNIYSDDSLCRTRAYKSVDDFSVKEDKKDSLKFIIDNYKFPKMFIDTKKSLIGEYVNMKTMDDDYIEQLYKNAGDTSMYQIKILNGLARKNTKSSIKTYLKLLDYDVPISNNGYMNKSIFYPYSNFSKKGNNASKVFPELLEYNFISKYRFKIIDILASQVDSNIINPKVYKKKVPQLLREAKIVLKEQISEEQSKQSEGESSYRSYYSKNYKNETNDLLVNYAKILMPYYQKNKKVQAFIEKIGLLQNFDIRTKVFALQQYKYGDVDSQVWEILAKDEVNLSVLYKVMKDYNISDLFPKEYKKQHLIAQSLLLDKGVDFEKDSVIYLGKRYVNTGYKQGWVYFFKTKKENNDNWQLNYIGFQPENIDEISLNKNIVRRRSFIDKAEKMDDLIDEKIDIIRLRNHPHADGSWDN